MERKLEHLLEIQREDRQVFEGTQSKERQQRHAAYHIMKQQINEEREAKKLTGLPAFLAKVSGVALARERLHKQQDWQRLQQHRQGMQVLKEQQRQQHEIFQRQQEMKALELVRQQRALEQKDKREMQSLNKSFELEENRRMRGGAQHMPGIELKLSPRGRPTMVFRAKQRFTSELAQEVQREKRLDTNERDEYNSVKFNTASKNTAQSSKDDQMKLNNKKQKRER